MPPELVKQPSIPEPPEIVGALAPLPSAKRREWREAYGAAFKQAAIDSPGDESAQRQAALRDANRIFRVGEPGSLAEARALGEWQLIRRSEQNGTLAGVTIDGAKFTFDAPAPAAPPEKGKAAGGKE
jgi:hypothetical protein